MSTELLTWVHHYLERDEDIIVPIKKMWNEWAATHSGPPLEAFTALLLSDKDIAQERGVDHTEGFEDWSPEELAEYERDMEASGYFSGPRVRLKSREITLEHIVRMITKHNDRMERALLGAREAMPEDITEPQEGQLIDAIFMARELRQKLREAGLEAGEGQQE